MKKIIFCFLFFFLFPLSVFASLEKDFAEIEGETIWMGWTEEESGGDYKMIQKVPETQYGNAYGRYQFDYQFALQEYLKRLYQSNENLYEELKPYVESSNFKNYFVAHKSEFISLWKKISNFEDENFKTIQDDLAYELYYEPTKKELKNFGIDLDQFGSVIKGTVWSVAIREGPLSNSLNSYTYKALVETYEDGISDEDYLEQIMNKEYDQRHDSRWNSTQKSKAINAMKVEDQTHFSSSSPVGGIFGGTMIDPYPNIFGKVNTRTNKEIGCNTLFFDKDGNETDLKIFFNDLFFIIRIGSVSLVVILSTIDYFKLLLGSFEDLKKVNSKTMKRIMIGLVIFFLPNLLELIFQLFGLYDISNCGIS